MILGSYQKEFNTFIEEPSLNIQIYAHDGLLLLQISLS